METERQQRKSMKQVFFKKFNKIDKSLSIFTQNKREGTNN